MKQHLLQNEACILDYMFIKSIEKLSSSLFRNCLRPFLPSQVGNYSNLYKYTETSHP